MRPSTSARAQRFTRASQPSAPQQGIKGLAVGKDDGGHRAHVPFGGAAWRGDHSTQIQGHRIRIRHIFVQQGRKGLSKAGRKENKKLSTIMDFGSSRGGRARQAPGGLTLTNGLILSASSPQQPSKWAAVL